MQYRVAMERVPGDWLPVLSQMQVTYIDSTQGPNAQEAADSGSFVKRLTALVSPVVISRAAWGADERYRYDQGKEALSQEYAPVQKIIVHHTANTNGPADPAAVMRAIYLFHAVTLGWGDIGYNFLIDAEGRVYEGRAGGPNVVGIHAIDYNQGSVGVALIGTFEEAMPTTEAAHALEGLLLAKVVEHGIDPRGRSILGGTDLPTIIGHRDVTSTSCPGAQIYSQLPAFRERVFANLPPYGEAWMDDTTPRIMEPGTSTTVEVTLRNSGTAAWTPQSADRVLLGFRWYGGDGKLYEDEPDIEYRTPLPRTVRPGEAVTVEAVVRAPGKMGRYTLRWDMVHERTSWFETQGNRPLDRIVSVIPFTRLTNEELAALPNEQLVLLPEQRLRALPLGRLQQFSDADLVEYLPRMIPLFGNERILLLSNDVLLRYLSDARLRTFAMARIRTFPASVQQRIGFSPGPAPSSAGQPGSLPDAIEPLRSAPTSTPTARSVPTSTPSSGWSLPPAIRIDLTFTPTPPSSPQRTATPTLNPTSAPTRTPTRTPTPTPTRTPTRTPTPTASPTPISTRAAYDPGGAVAP